MSALTLLVEEVAERHMAPYAALSLVEYGALAAVSDPEHLRWKFLQNPQGASVGIHLLSEDRLVGRLVAQPRTFIDEQQRSTSIAYMVDLLVHPEFRSMAALASLARGMQQIRARFDGVLVTPNAAGAAVWGGLLNVRARFNFAVAALPLRPAAIAARRWSSAFRVLRGGDAIWMQGLRLLSAGSRYTVDEQWPAPDELSSVLAAAQGEVAHADATAAFVTWRFRDSPVYRYDCRWVRERGRLIGGIATRRAPVDGYDTRFVVGAFGALDAAQSRALLQSVVRLDTLAGGAELLLFPAGGAGRAVAMLRRNLVRLPAALVPQQLTVFADWYRASSFAWTPQGVSLTLADCDMI